MKKIFISYSRANSREVLQIVSRIEDAIGEKCWVDITGIESSDQFRDVIVRAIDDCEIMLFMLSEESMSSDFAKREVLYAKSKGKKVVPICLGASKPREWFAFEFAGVNYIRANNNLQFDILLRDLKKWLRIEPLGPEPGSSPKSVFLKLLILVVFLLLGLLSFIIYRYRKSINTGIDWLVEKEYYNIDQIRKNINIDTIMIGNVPICMIHLERTTGDYYLGMVPVTCRQWRSVMHYNRDEHPKWDAPVTGVNWYDCIDFVITLSEITKLKFSLPSVEEWNYAAKANSFYTYSGSDNIEEVAWYEDNCNELHSVGQKKPNSWGFYDMSGSIWEWCSDDVESTKPFKLKAVCGGSWSSPKEHCIVGNDAHDNYIIKAGSRHHGFRVKLESLDTCGVSIHIDSLRVIAKAFVE